MEGIKGFNLLFEEGLISKVISKVISKAPNLESLNDTKEALFLTVH